MILLQMFGFMFLLLFFALWWKYAGIDNFVFCSNFSFLLVLFKNGWSSVSCKVSQITFEKYGTNEESDIILKGDLLQRLLMAVV